METAEELMLSAEEYKALLQVRAMLHDTEARYEEVMRRNPNKRYLDDTKEISLLDGFGGFDMGNTCLSTEDLDVRDIS